MQENHLYEYSVIRVVPRVERGEFINVGLVMFSKKAKFLKVRYHVDERKLNLIGPDLDIECLYENLRSFSKICDPNGEGGFIGSLDIPDRFRWLTAVRSATIQTSRPHGGLSTDLAKTFERLFEELVM